jgi:hypothetical protein
MTRQLSPLWLRDSLSYSRGFEPPVFLLTGGVMSRLEEIIKSKTKPKEKMNLLVEEIKSDPALINDIINMFGSIKDPEKGTYLSVLNIIAKEEPKVIEPYINWVIDKIDYKAPRVKWESSEIIGNIAKTYPDKVVAAIPRLLTNTKYEGTVVKWSAAFGLTEIAKANPKTHKEIIPFFEDRVENEKENGVRNIYLKALKAITKKK